MLLLLHFANRNSLPSIFHSPVRRVYVPTGRAAFRKKGTRIARAEEEERKKWSERGVYRPRTHAYTCTVNKRPVVYRSTLMPVILTSVLRSRVSLSLLCLFPARALSFSPFLLLLSRFFPRPRYYRVRVLYSHYLWLFRVFSPLFRVCVLFLFSRSPYLCILCVTFWQQLPPAITYIDRTIYSRYSFYRGTYRFRDY